MIEDRLVYRDGVRVGRIMLYEFGPMKNVWQWYGMWNGNDQVNQGQADTRDQALEAIRERAPGDAQIYTKSER